MSKFERTKDHFKIILSHKKGYITAETKPTPAGAKLGLGRTGVGIFLSKDEAKKLAVELLKFADS